MKKQYFTYGLCVFLITINVSCIASNNSYELLYEKELAKENPKYFEEIEQILSKFQNHLIANRIIANTNNRSYIQLLNKIKKENVKGFEISYDLDAALNKLNRIEKIEPLSIEGRAHIQKKLFDKGSDLYGIPNVYTKSKNGELNNAIIAKNFLEFYNKQDYSLPMVRVKLFRFLDSKSNGVRYIYLGRPTKE